jgi:hypothetical protein
VFARVSEYEVRPERLDEMDREGKEHVLPALRMQEGFGGGLVLVDRPSGKVIAVTLWESERAMELTEEAAYWLRCFGAEAGDGRLMGVERYEVFYSEVKGAQP